MAFAPSPDPKGPLNRYRILSPNAAVRVSPLCLGAMNLGTAWKDFMGGVDKEESFKLLDYFYDQGGNFIDTANGYQNEQSETWIGEWMQKRGNRSEIVLATKFTSSYKTSWEDYPIHVNYTGNSSKSLHVSVEDSLKKLQTDYIDLLYVHWWDYTTSIEELAHSLDNLVKQGKVLYLGVSDTPAWIVSQFNQYAKDRGLRPFSVYQGRWSASERDFEREILPMARTLGLALCPWGALGGGRYKTEEQIAELKKRNEEGRTPFQPPSDGGEADRRITKVLDKIAKSKGPDIGVTGIALAYVMHKAPDVHPIVGGRKIDHLKENIAALKVRLTDEEIKEIEEAGQDFKMGFPHDFLGGGEHGAVHSGEVALLNRAGHYDFHPPRKPILPPYKS